MHLHKLLNQTADCHRNFRWTNFKIKLFCEPRWIVHLQACYAALFQRQRYLISTEQQISEKKNKQGSCKLLPDHATVLKLHPNDASNSLMFTFAVLKRRIIACTQTNVQPHRIPLFRTQCRPFFIHHNSLAGITRSLPSYSFSFSSTIMLCTAENFAIVACTSAPPVP